MKQVAFAFVALLLAGADQPRREPLSQWITSAATPEFSFCKRGEVTFIRLEHVLSGTLAWSVTYTPEGTSMPRPLTGSIVAVSEVLQTEFPDGVSPDFMGPEFLRVLSYCFETQWGAFEFTDEEKKRLWSVLMPEAFDGEFKLLEQLFETPKIEVDGNGWQARYVVIGQSRSLQLKAFRGTLKPFVIESMDARFLLPSSYWLQRNERDLSHAVRMMKAPVASE
jgi:hypothetical protein